MRARPERGQILLVDDEPSLRRAAARLLQSIGYQVLHASDGKECLQVYDEAPGRIALVLLDRYMPMLSGEDALLALRARSPWLPVVLMSGYGDTPSTQDGTQYLPKPFSLDALLDAMAAAFAAADAHPPP